MAKKKVMTDLAQALDTVMDLHSHNMLRSRPYNGQPWTDNGIRGSTEVKGVTFRDIKDAYIRARILASDYQNPKNALLIEQAQKGELAALNSNDLYEIEGSVDPMVVAQMLTCEIEKLMGIFPNTNLPGIPSSGEILNAICDPSAEPGAVIIPFMPSNNKPN